MVVHEAFGDATVDSRFTIFSATKAFVASVVWQLIGEGLLDPDQLVADLLPSFGTNGKDVITLEHVLLHTSGFPMAPLEPSGWDTHEGRAAAFARVAAQLGRRHEVRVPPDVGALGAGRAHPRRHRRGPHRRGAHPCGRAARAQGLRPRGRRGGPGRHRRRRCPAASRPSPDELEAALGIREIAVGEVTEEALLGLNDPAARAVGLPGGGGVATAADVATFYQALLHDPGGLWDAAVLDGRHRRWSATPSRTRCSAYPINRTRGLVLAGDDGRSNLRGMGRTVSPGTFGHNGAGGQVAWADPASGLSFCYLTNGRDRNFLREHRRTTAVASLAGVCATA